MIERKKALVGLCSVIFLILACGIIPPNVIATETLIPSLTAQPQIEPTIEIQVPTAAYIPLTLETLKNAQYHSPDWGDFQLTDGTYFRTPAIAGESPQIYLTQLDELVIFGDLNADGIEDATAFLHTQNGGTGNFVELAAVLNQSGNAKNVSTLYLGDRVVVLSAQIVDGVIILDMRVHGPNDGLCCPSQLERWQFRLEYGQLIRLP